MYRYEDIKTVHLEITQKCQAACPMCDRNENGGKDNKHITNAELSLADCKSIFSPEFIKQLNNMYMCGNLGDPIVAKDTLEVFDYFRSFNEKMWLSMNTNAGAKPVEWWQELAGVIGKKGAVIFSVDGLSDTNHLYRQNVVWDNVERNMRAFVDAGGRARWASSRSASLWPREPSGRWSAAAPLAARRPTAPMLPSKIPLPPSPWMGRRCVAS